MSASVAAHFRARACPRWLRLACHASFALAWVNLLELGVRLALDVLDPADRAPLPFLVRRAFFFSAIPALLAEALLFARRSRLELSADTLVLLMPGHRVEIPRASIQALSPLRPPWIRLRLRSGDLPLELAPQSGFAAALGFTEPPRAPRFLWLKLAAVPLVLTLVLFNLHQHIAYGGFFGEWRLVSPARWLRTLTGVALSVYIPLLAWDAWLRLAAEILALKLPRRPLAIAAAAVYLAGIIALIALRLLN